MMNNNYAEDADDECMKCSDILLKKYFVIPSQDFLV